MTKPEVLRLFGVMADHYGHRFEVPAGGGPTDKWVRDLELLDAEQVNAALETWMRDGETWPPTSGELRNRLIDLLLDVPDWSVVKAALTMPVVPVSSATVRECPVGKCDGGGHITDEVARVVTECECRDELVAGIRSRSALRHPLIMAWLEITPSIELRDLAEDRTAAAQVRNAWLAFVEDQRRTFRYADLADAGLPQLQRVKTNARKMIGPGGTVHRPGLTPAAKAIEKIAAEAASV